MTKSEMLFDGPAGAVVTVVLAHGAGAPMDTPFMNAVAAGLAQRKIRVVRFEFPYMHRRRVEGKAGGPDRDPVLRATWLEVIGLVAGAGKLVIGGKSMGGRYATLVADESAAVAAVVCLGYPFHPPGRLDQPRTAHLARMQRPTLILQGTRDTFGKPEEVAGYDLSKQIRVHWLVDGDHSLKPRKSSGRTEAGNLDEAVTEIAGFVGAI